MNAKNGRMRGLWKRRYKIAYDENRRVYGQRKLKHVLLRKGWVVSRRKIGRIMKKRGLVSAYTRKKYRVHAAKVNEALVSNLLDRQFNNIRLHGTLGYLSPVEFRNAYTL